MKCYHCNSTGKIGIKTVFGIIDVVCPNCNDTGDVREPVGRCWICDKELYRDEHSDWVVFDRTIVCRNHPGVKGWYKGALRMADEKLKLCIEE